VVDNDVHVDLQTATLLFAAEARRRRPETQCGINDKSSAAAEMGDRGHNRHEPKIGGCAAFFEAGAGSSSSTIWSGLEADLYDTKWLLDPSSRLATIGMNRKLGTVPPFLWRGAKSPSNTMWPGPRPTSMPSAILILPALWSQ